MREVKSCDSIAGVSWPAPPFENAFIETASDMFERLGVSVRPGNPTIWSTALQFLTRLITNQKYR